MISDAVPAPGIGLLYAISDVSGIPAGDIAGWVMVVCNDDGVNTIIGSTDDHGQAGEVLYAAAAAMGHPVASAKVVVVPD